MSTKAEKLKQYVGENRRWTCSRPLTDEEYRAQLIRRFWQYVDKTPGQGKGDCWLWSGSCDTAGYGQTAYRWPEPSTRPMKTHVLSFLIHHNFEPIPQGRQICHKCDNPPCCNPDHLWCGTPKANVHDAQLKGRMPTRARIVRDFAQRIHVTPEQGAMIRTARKKKGLSIYDVSYMAGVDFTHYSRVERGRRGLRVEQIHFLLRFLEIDESAFNIQPEQFFQQGKPVSDPLSKPRAGTRHEPRVRVFPKLRQDNFRPHVLWQKIKPDTQEYRADLICVAFKEIHKSKSLGRIASDIGIRYDLLRKVLQGAHVTDRILNKVISYAGLSIEQVTISQQKLAA